MSFLSRLRNRSSGADAHPVTAVEAPPARPEASFADAPGPQPPDPVPADPAVQAARPSEPVSEDVALAEAVLRMVEKRQTGRAIEKAGQIAHRFVGTQAVLPLMAALQQLEAPANASWKASERASIEKAIGEALNVARPSPDQLDRLIESSQSPSPVVRRYAMTKLSDLGEVATDPLIAGLHDLDDLVRMWAASALGPPSARDLRRVHPLVEALADSRWTVRSRAAASLARLMLNATTMAGVGTTVAPSSELKAQVLAALEEALEEARAGGSGAGLEASEAQSAARVIAEAIPRIRDASR
jgi:hypothetical protein